MLSWRFDEGFWKGNCSGGVLFIQRAPAIRFGKRITNLGKDRGILFR